MSGKGFVKLAWSKQADEIKLARKGRHHPVFLQKTRVQGPRYGDGSTLVLFTYNVKYKSSQPAT
jgi:hypothetical protein